MSVQIDLRNDRRTPRWLLDILRFLPLKSQFILHGNIRDRHAVAGANGRYVPLPLINYLAECLKAEGYRRFIRFDRIHGFTPVCPVSDPVDDHLSFFKDKFSMDMAQGGHATSLEKS